MQALRGFLPKQCTETLRMCCGYVTIELHTEAGQPRPAERQQTLSRKGRFWYEGGNDRAQGLPVPFGRRGGHGRRAGSQPGPARL